MSVSVACDDYVARPSFGAPGGFSMPSLSGSNNRSSNMSLGDAVDQYIDLCSRFNDQLEAVKDKSDALSATPKIEALADDFKKLQGEFQQMQIGGDQEAAALMMTKLPDIKAQQDRFAAVMSRIHADEGVNQVIQFSVMKTSFASDDVLNAIRRMGMNTNRAPTASRNGFGTPYPGTPGGAQPGSATPAGMGLPRNRPSPLASRFPPELVTTIKVKGLINAGKQGSFLMNHLRDLGHATDAEGAGAGNEYTISIAPAPDRYGLVSMIDFGTATLHAETGTIEVQADLAKLDQLMAASAPGSADGQSQAGPSSSGASPTAPGNSIAPSPADAAATPAPASPDTPSATPPAGGAVAGTPAADAGTNAAPHAKPMPKVVHPGMKVQVLKDGSWYAATLLNHEGRRYQIRFDDPAQGSDQWVTKDHIRPAD